MKYIKIGVLLNDFWLRWGDLNEKQTWVGPKIYRKDLQLLMEPCLAKAWPVLQGLLIIYCIALPYT